MDMRRLIPVVLVAIAGCGSSVDIRDSGNLAYFEPADVHWQWIEVSAEGQVASVEVMRFDKPAPLNTRRLDRTRRDTQLNTWLSLQSYQHRGGMPEDLQGMAGHFSDPQAFMASVYQRGHNTAERYFDTQREVNLRPEVLGLIRHGGDMLVVYQFPVDEYGGEAFRTSVNMVYMDGRYCVKWPDEFTNPFFKKIHDQNYSIVARPLP